MVRPVKKKGGASSLYCTRNQALQKLQLRLPDFRRLCILKGIHPREPRKKTSGAHRTYYHVKDISFLLHEPLLAVLRASRTHARKVRRAQSRNHDAGAERLRAAAPRFVLDGLVRERYPSFGDALRDLDDPLTLLSLFAVLPAERARGIPAERVAAARRLTNEFVAFVTRTSSLRKAFVSVKGIYFQAVIEGEPVTWLVPHALAQVLPADVDYKVMLTFCEFDEALLSFVNFKLYHSLGLSYPPQLDKASDDGAAGAGALRLSLGGTTNGGAVLSSDGGTVLGADDGPDGGDAAVLRSLFADCVVLLGRETPREALGFVIRSCGGTVLWDEPSPSLSSPQSDKLLVTHVVCDRPTQPVAGREAVQPQWVFDSLNFRVLCPTGLYSPEASLPPHLSPFVDNAAEGYAPEFAAQALAWRAAGAEAAEAPPLRSAPDPNALKPLSGADAEEEYAAQMRAEMGGGAAGGADAEPRPAQRGTARPPPPMEAPPSSEKEVAEMAHVLLPRKRKELYKAMQMGLAKKAAKVSALAAKRPAA